MAEAVVGIVGGMGPESTIDLMKKIFDRTPAQREQDHIHLIVDSNPKTPDRTAHIIGQGASPMPLICEGIRRVTAAGADLIAIPCNTAHVFIEDLRAATHKPVLDMVELCAKAGASRFGARARFGILATTGTVQSGLYADRFRRHDLKVMTPKPAEQHELMEAIYGPQGIKLGHLRDNAPRVLALGRRLIERGCSGVVAACTEVTLVMAGADFPMIDPVEHLAQEIVARVKGN